MKKNVLKLTTVTAFLMVSINFYAQETKVLDVATMEAQVEVLKLKTDLLNKKISLEKEKQNNAKLINTVESLNQKSDKATDNYAASDPKSTAKDAKNTAKLLKKVESANNDLTKSNNKMIDLEGEIRKLNSKLDRMKYIVEVKEK